jgi:hypothetical protein
MEDGNGKWKMENGRWQMEKADDIPKYVFHFTFYLFH